MTMSTTTAPARDLLLAAADDFQAGLSAAEPARLVELRRVARERFGELGIPTTRLEEWRFTNVAPIARSGFRPAGDFTEVDPRAIARYQYDDCLQIGLVNGRFVDDLTRLDGLPDGVVVCSMADALELYP